MPEGNEATLEVSSSYDYSCPLVLDRSCLVRHLYGTRREKGRNLTHAVIDIYKLVKELVFAAL